MHQELIAFMTRFADKFNGNFNRTHLFKGLFRDFVTALLNSAIDLSIDRLPRNPLKQRFGVGVDEMLGVDRHEQIVESGVTIVNAI
jgi:hypothetical protein